MQSIYKHILTAFNQIFHSDRKIRSAIIAACEFFVSQTRSGNRPDELQLFGNFDSSVNFPKIKDKAWGRWDFYFIGDELLKCFVDRGEICYLLLISRRKNDSKIHRP
ncbi:hypothetical protein SAMN06297164_2791 [Nitrosomonas ureae]|uniref:Uncharacterized protein n=1 Tax=Nitrosomonas ureae TaxID=44577 RepID=A0A286AFS2_9PROT|nr:hypothetical protein SAMN06297164_2791 [Nitrosomonas ureae]